MQALHDGGMSSARARLEDGQAAGEDNLAASMFDGKKRHTIAVLGSDVGGPKWGATEVRPATSRSSTSRIMSYCVHEYHWSGGGRTALTMPPFRCRVGVTP